jgi:hypothetical protein
MNPFKWFRSDGDDIRDRIERLAADGDVRSAIALAQAEAVSRKDCDLHNRAMQMRIDAANHLMTATTPKGDWPRALADPFPDCSGIPEIDAAQLNGAIVGGSILHHGSLLVRGLVARDRAIALSREIDRVFESYDQWNSDEDRTDFWFSPIDIRSTEMIEGRKSQHNLNRYGLGSVMIGDSPALFGQVLALYSESPVLAAIEDYLGERPVLTFGKTVARRVVPKGNPGSFHQDGAFLGPVRTVNVWTALSDCGVDAPGMEVVDRRLSSIVPTGTDDALADWTVGDRAALRANGDRPFARPVFSAGDALLFDEMNLHRTSIDEGMTKPRYALESWFFAPSASTDYAVPILL